MTITTERQSLRTYLQNEAITLTKLTRVNRPGQLSKWWGWGLTPDNMKIRVTLYPEDQKAITAQGYDTSRWDNPRQYDDAGDLELIPYEQPTVTIRDTTSHGWRIDEVLHIHDGSWRKVVETVTLTLPTLTEIDPDTLTAGDVLKDRFDHCYVLTVKRGDCWQGRNVTYADMVNVFAPYQLRQMTIVKRAEMRVGILDTRYLLPARTPQWWVTDEIAQRWDYIGCAAHYKATWLKYAKHSSQLLTFQTKAIARENMRNAWSAMALWIWDARGDCWYTGEPTMLERWYYWYALSWMLRAVVAWVEVQIVLSALSAIELEAA